MPEDLLKYLENPDQFQIVEASDCVKDSVESVAQSNTKTVQHKNREIIVQSSVMSSSLLTKCCSIYLVNVVNATVVNATVVNDIITENEEHEVIIVDNTADNCFSPFNFAPGPGVKSRGRKPKMRGGPPIFNK